MSAMTEDYRQRQDVNAQTHGINRFSLYIVSGQWSCSCPATCQRACVMNQKQPMNVLYCSRYCCFLMFISTKVHDTELTTVTACYLWM